MAFDVVFGIFVSAFAIWAALTVRWAFRRDRAARVSQRRDTPDE